MQQVHRALLEQAAGTWPLIFEKRVGRIQTCDHNVNGKTFSEVVEFRDAPGRQEVYNIAARFDDVELIRQLPILTKEWEECRLPDKCGKSVAESLFDQLDPKTQLVQAILHRKVDLLSKLLNCPISINTVRRILTVRDDVEIRQWISSAGIVENSDAYCPYNLSTDSIQWLLDQGVNYQHFNLHHLWGTTKFEQAFKTTYYGSLRWVAMHGVNVVLDLASRFPHWSKTFTLSMFLINGDEVAVNILWRDNFEDIIAGSHMFDLDTTKWILSRCNQSQLEYLQQRWSCRDFEVAKYLHTRGFMIHENSFGICVESGTDLFKVEADAIITIFSNVSLAVLDELYTLGYLQFEIVSYQTYSIPVIQWVARRSGLPQTITFEPPTSQKQLEWLHSHYVFDNIYDHWKIKK